MFRASLCPSSGEQDLCYCTWCAALVLLDVVGSGCGALRYRMRTVTFTVLASYNAAPHNRPKHVETEADNKNLTAASCWFSLSLHNFLTMHGHRNLKQKESNFS